MKFTNEIVQIYIPSTNIKKSMNGIFKIHVNGEESPVISFKTNDIELLHNKLKTKGYEVSDISEYGIGANGIYKDFYMTDPDQNLLEINSYPDLQPEQFRRYSDDKI